MEGKGFDWKREVVKFSTDPRHLYKTCEICGKEVPRNSFDAHTGICHVCQSKTESNVLLRAAEETDKEASGVLVVGREKTMMQGLFTLSHVGGIAPMEPHNIQENSSLVGRIEQLLPSGLQVINNDASSSMVAGKFPLTLMDLCRIFPTKIYDVCQKIMTKNFEILKQRLEVIKQKLTTCRIQIESLKKKIESVEAKLAHID